MRESYVKPVLFFESFALSQTIAKFCENAHQSGFGEPNHYNETECAWDTGAYALFLTTTAPKTCDFPMDDYEGEDMGGMCYNNPSGGQAFFAS